MLTKTVEIEVGELTVGMFVAELDRPWLDSPFPFQGFRITEPEEVDTLRRLCKRVRIDITAGEEPKPRVRLSPSRQNADAEQSNEIFRNPARREAEVSRPVEEELTSAKQVHSELVERCQRPWKNCARDARSRSNAFSGHATIHREH